MVYKSILIHPPARDFQLAGCAAAKQGKFAEFERGMWSLTDGGPDRGGFQWDRSGLNMVSVYKMADALEIDVPKMQRDMKSVCVKQLASDQADMRRFGVRGTPGFFINGRFLGGAQPFESFSRLVEEELKKFKGSGVLASHYYKSRIMKRGKATCCAGSKNQPRRPRRPARPDPSVTYAVPVGNSITVGPQDAMITIIEGFEFM